MHSSKMRPAPPHVRTIETQQPAAARGLPASFTLRHPAPCKAHVTPTCVCASSASPQHAQALPQQQQQHEQQQQQQHPRRVIAHAHIEFTEAAAAATADAQHVERDEAYREGSSSSQPQQPGVLEPEQGQQQQQQQYEPTEALQQQEWEQEQRRQRRRQERQQRKPQLREQRQRRRVREQEERSSMSIPAAEVWSEELRHMQSLLTNPHTPLVREFVLQQCYLLNSSSTQQQYRQLPASAMASIASGRQRLEQAVSKGAHSLSAAWRRLQLLGEAVVEQGAAATEQQLAKERELLVDLRDRLHNAQRLYTRSRAKAAELSDKAFLSRSRLLNTLLLELTATTEAYLHTSMARIAAGSKVNTMFRNAWLKTPPAQRPPPAVAEAQRQAQLSALLPLTPPHPSRLLLDQYKQAAVAFQLHKDKALLRRPPSAGMPSSTRGSFWHDDNDSSSSSGRSGGVAASPAAAAADGLTGVAPPWSPGWTHAAAAAAADQPQQDQDAARAHAQDSRSEGGEASIQHLPPLLTPGEGAWRQPPVQLNARPAQQLPLLPHLARPWVKQQTVLFKQQRLEEHKRKQLEALEAIDWRNPRWSNNGTSDVDDGLQLQQQQEEDTLSPLLSRSPISLSGKVVPPLNVLLQRALEVEQQLLGVSDLEE